MKKKDLARLIDYSKLKFRVKNSMRYNDVGDYYDSTIISYNMNNEVYNNGILLHEFIEFNLIKSAGIPEALIDEFDTNDEAPEKYPKEYKLYSKYHRMANHVERHFIENMGMSWKEYQKTVYSIPVKVKKSKLNGIKNVKKAFKVK